MVSGYCYDTDQPLKRLTVTINDWATPVGHTCDLRSELIDKSSTEQDLNRIYSGFWTRVPLEEGLVGKNIDISLKVYKQNGAVQQLPLGTSALTSLRKYHHDYDLPAETEPPLIAICLCTYNPEIDTFQRQLDSILKQSHTNWICLINDDFSDSHIADQIQKICNQDPRIYFVRNEKNVGFYQNFEQCLRRVPDNVQYVTLSDQDDYWYPSKLERLLNEFRADTSLVYSDMRILKQDGEVVSPSYWLNRKNEYKDLSVVLVANTVTGAASLFRRDLLNYLLPFPTRVGDAFHDHWIACVALSYGKIRYIDEPLYDYYQHSEAVIGHCDFTPWPVWKRVWSFVNVLRRLCVPKQSIALLAQLRSASLGVYHFECRRLELIVETIRLRGLAKPTNRSALRLFGHGLMSGIRLLTLHAKVLAQRKTTDDAELRLALGYFVKWFEDKRITRQKKKQFGRVALDVSVS